MAKDPVNGNDVQEMLAITSIYDGKTYYFSSQETAKEFARNPEKYAA